MSEYVISGEIPVVPVLPLRDVVVFPYMVVPLFVGRAKSIKALEIAMSKSREILLLAQKNPTKDEPEPEDLYNVGCVGQLLQLLKLPDGTVKVLVEGRERVAVDILRSSPDMLSAVIRNLPSQNENSPEIEGLKRAALNQFEQFIKLNKKIPSEVFTSVSSMDDPGKIADAIATHLPLKLEQKQSILEDTAVDKRLESLLNLIDSEIDILQIEKRIRGRVKRQMEKNQRDYYLNEQVKAIQKELGEGEDGNDFDAFEKKIAESGLSKEAEEKAKSELRKLKLMPPMSAEATVVRNYLDALLDLPWKKKTKINGNLVEGERILDEDHYGLDKVKERISEYLAVQQRVDKVKSPILCLVGPPGVGKTSLGESIARATNRKFVRMALGGVRDEAEIRGHRRTYIGSMMGKILQSLQKSGVRNPLFLLDEVDKMGQDYRGDPASALLEVLDPEQNSKFQDHYIEVDFDLSDVMFVATANTMDIPLPLLDRMEVIRLSGYTEEEKVNIAMRYLLPKQIELNGLAKGELEITESAVRDIIRYYSRESGVRSLEREISKICRKVVKSAVIADSQLASAAAEGNADEKAKQKSKVKKVKKNAIKVKVSENELVNYLGAQKYSFGVAEKENQVGQLTGLAWTEVGGEILNIECQIFPGKGEIMRTGSLGDVMKESVEAARSLLKARADRLGIKREIFEKYDMHIHLPEGATPKDGPSAGIGMTTVMLSALTNIPVRCDVCMTGEITLRGEVLAIGGLKEKLLAAVRGGLKKALIPSENVKDIAELPDTIKENIEIVPVKWIDQVFEHALEYMPTPLQTDAELALVSPEVVANNKGSKKVTGGVIKH